MKIRKNTPITIYRENGAFFKVVTVNDEFGRHDVLLKGHGSEFTHGTLEWFLANHFPNGGEELEWEEDEGEEDEGEEG